MFHKAGEIAAVSGLYVLAAQVGLLTGVERDMPLLIWPASGIAAAAVILLGNGGVVGVWLGAFLATLALYNGFLPLRTSVPAAAFVGIFASLQALLVVRLAARWIGPFPKEPRLSHLLRFSTVAAVSAAVGTTAGIATILAAGVPLAAPVAIAWLSAWAGNLLGIVLFTPFLLMLHRWFHSESIEHQLAPMIFGLGIGLALLIFLLLWKQENERIRVLFEGEAVTTGAEFQEMLDRHMHALDSARNLMLTSELVERHEFETFSRLHASDLDVPGLVGLAWAPRVAESERAAFEAGLPASEPRAIQITAWDAPGEDAPAAPDGIYFPISYLYPQTDNAALLGLDLGTIPEAAGAMSAAAATGAAAMTAPFALSWLPDAPTGVMSILPIATTDRSTAEVAGQEGELAGYLVAFMRADAMLAAVTAGTDMNDRDIYVVDAAADGQLLAAQSVRSGDTGRTAATAISTLRSDLPVTMSNRTWMISSVALPGFGAQQRTGLPVSAALTVLTVASLLSVYVARRQHGAEILRQSQEKYRLLAENISDVIWLMDAETSQFVYVSPSVEALTGYPPADLLSKDVPPTLIPDSTEWATRTLPSRLAAFQRQEKDAYVDEVAIARADGTHVWTEIMTRYQIDAETGRVLIYGVSRNIDERKTIEKALHRSEMQFRTLFEGAAEGIIAADINSLTFAFVNPTICALFGYTADEFLRLGVQDLHPPQARSQAMAGFQALATGTKQRITDLPCVRRDGTLFYADVTGSPVDIDGEDYIVGFFTDVTHRTLAEKALHWETSLLRSLLNSIPDLVFFKDVDSVYLGCNEAFESLYGAKEADLVGKSDYDFTSPEQAAFFQAHDRSMLASGRPQRNEEWLTFADGREALFDTLKTPLYGPDGEQRGVLGISRDITESRRVEELLRTRIWLAEYAATHTLEALCQEVVDQAEKLTGSQAGFLHLVHADQNEIELQTWSTNTMQSMCTADSALIHYSVDAAGIWADCVRIKRPIRLNNYAGAEGRRGLPPGHAPISRLMTAPIVRSGQTVAILGVGNKAADYTEQDLEFLVHIATSAWDIILRKQAQDDLHTERAALAQHVEERTADLSLTNVQLEHALRVKNEFLANMSHELRTPLNAILALSETLREQLRGPLNEHQQKAVRIIEESGHHLLALINDILDLSKLEAGKLEIMSQPVLLVDVCESSLAFVKQLALKKNLTVTYNQEDR
ncbi:MAG: PAS domain S-box protein, partial [Caldilinea sp.]|nr:PAS domain S-box protein [Caldilinea sp.]